MENKKPCGHTGKFTGIGQTVASQGGQLIIISSIVCGECGQQRVEVNNMSLELKKSVIETPVPMRGIPNLGKQK